MDQVTIRELSGFDEIVTIYSLCRHTSSLPEAAFRERIGAMLAQGHYRCIAAYLGVRMVGVSGFWTGTQLWCGKYVEPDHVVVDPELRGIGVGARLMAWMEAEAERLGCDVLRVAMVLSNDRARGFYHRSGYADDGLILVNTLSPWAQSEFPEYAAHKAKVRADGGA